LRLIYVLKIGKLLIATGASVHIHFAGESLYRDGIVVGHRASAACRRNKAI